LRLGAGFLTCSRRPPEGLYVGAGFSRPPEGGLYLRRGRLQPARRLLTVAGPSGLFTQFPCRRTWRSALFPGRVELW